jgi:hypothetical protein
MREEAEIVAREFHHAYMDLSPYYGWISDVTRIPWEDLPHANRNLMIATALNLLERGVICTST